MLLEYSVDTYHPILLAQSMLTIVYYDLFIYTFFFIYIYIYSAIQCSVVGKVGKCAYIYIFVCLMQVIDKHHYFFMVH